MLEFKRLTKIGNFEVPVWWDCQWRRVACGQAECRLCGRINKHRQRHIQKDEDPDSWESVFDDMSRDFAEAKTMLRQDAKRFGIDIDNIDDTELPKEPELEDFPLYHQVMQWHKLVHEIIAKAADTEESWLVSESGQDLTWYYNTIAVKTMRQLSTRWDIEHDNGMSDEVDYKYTQYVLKECISIVEQALEEIISQSLQEVNLHLILKQLRKLKVEILTI